MVVSAGISNHQKMWLLGSCLHLASEVSKSQAANSGRGSGSSGKLQPIPLAGIPGASDSAISHILSDNNGRSHQQKLLLGAPQIYDVDAIT